MASLTPHYQLQELNQGDPFSTNGQKFTTSDRVTIDRLLYMGAQAHHHTGQTTVQADPAAAGTLQASTSGGTLPAGARVSYVFTWVDANGFETGPSPAVFVDLPSQISSPNPPAALATTGTGTLPAGGYYYAVSAYTGTNTSETAASTPTYCSLSAIGEITLTMPSLPSGATGFNIYRLDPHGANYLYVTSTTGTSFIDNGSIAENCNRLAPSTNNTHAANQVTFTLPQQAPAGFTWNLYRTTTTGSWTNSLLANNASNVTTFVDTGQSTLAISPPLSSQLIGSPSKIDLGSEVQGILPSSMVDFSQFLIPQAVTFTFAGTLTAQTGVTVWTNPFPWARIAYVMCSLGRGSSPASQPVLVDVKLNAGDAASWSGASSIFAHGAHASIPVGKQVGAPQSVGNLPYLFFSDMLSVDIVQAGGGATPTDHDLTVTIVLYVGLAGAPTNRNPSNYGTSYFVGANAANSGSGQFPIVVNTP